MADFIEQYFELQQQIHDYFGYEENWCVYPMDDLTDQYWCIRGEGDDQSVVFHDEYLTQDIVDTNLFYENFIHKDEFLEKSVYRTERHTMVLVDTQTDGNKFLCIFSNAKEIKAETLNFGD